MDKIYINNLLIKLLKSFLFILLWIITLVLLTVLLFTGDSGTFSSILRVSVNFAFVDNFFFDLSVISIVDTVSSLFLGILFVLLFLEFKLSNDVLSSFSFSFFLFGFSFCYF